MRFSRNFAENFGHFWQSEISAPIARPKSAIFVVFLPFDKFCQKITFWRLFGKNLPNGQKRQKSPILAELSEPKFRTTKNARSRGENGHFDGPGILTPIARLKSAILFVLDHFGGGLGPTAPILTPNGVKNRGYSQCTRFGDQNQI